MQLVPCGVDTVSVVRVHHEDKPLCVLVVVPPQRPDLVLPSYVPHCLKKSYDVWSSREQLQYRNEQINYWYKLKCGRRCWGLERKLYRPEFSSIHNLTLLRSRDFNRSLHEYEYEGYSVPYIIYKVVSMVCPEYDTKSNLLKMTSGLHKIITCFRTKLWQD